MERFFSIRTAYGPSHAPDGGHGLVKLANKLDALPRVAAFLDEHVMDD